MENDSSEGRIAMSEIKQCCPDMGLAIEEEFITSTGKWPYITQNGNDLWNIDHCPFCGKEIIVTVREEQS